MAAAARAQKRLLEINPMAHYSETVDSLAPERAAAPPERIAVLLEHIAGPVSIQRLNR